MSFDSGSGSDANAFIGFFKIVPEHPWQDQEVFRIIPNTFERKYRKTLSNPVFLRLPNGTEWTIFCKKRNEDILFKEDWKTFAKDCSLRYPHFLVFKYEGESRFEVRILDPPCITKSTGSDTIFDSYGYDINYDEVVKTENNVGFDANNRQRGSENSLTEYAGTGRICSKTEAILKQKETALQRAMKFRTKNPFFICRLRPSYIQRDILVIPREFSKKYLEGFVGTATIGVSDDRTWLVKISFNNNNNQSSITGGWIKISQEYKLEVDDICLFERTKCVPLTFKIVNFRDREDPEELQGYGHEANKQNKDKGLRRPIQNMEKGKRKRIEGISKSSPITMDLEDCGNLNMNENKFKIHIRSNHLKTSNAVYIPIAFLRKHPRCHGKDVKLQVGERSWSVRVKYYPGRHTFGRFSRGWIAFARECKLEVGNIFEFDMIDEEKLVFKVSISRNRH